MARATSEAAFSSGRFTAAAPPSGAKQQWPAIRGAVGQLQKLVVPNEGQRGALLYVPATYSPGAPTPLILSLHGAGGDAQGGLSHLVGHADAFGCLLLSPQSKGSTWDMLRGGYGPGGVHQAAWLLRLPPPLRLDLGQLVDGLLSAPCRCGLHQQSPPANL